MTRFLAIVRDTWRQSKKQVVFLLLLALLVLLAGLIIALPRTFDGQGGEKGFGTVFSDEPADFFHQQWTHTYAETLRVQRGEKMDISELEDEEAWKERLAAQEEAVKAATGLSKYRRSVEIWIFFGTGTMITISLLLFIAACAGYFPDLVAAGAVDLVLSKPASRLQVFAAKYAGGLALFTAAATLFSLAVFIGIGVRCDVWHARIFLALPLTIFMAALLYAFLALIGLVFRSTPLALLMGYVFYLIIDSAVGTIQQLQTAGLLQEIKILDRIVWVSRYTIPSFAVLKNAATQSVLNLPRLDWHPFAVATAWLFICLVLAHWRFRSSDF